MVQYKLKDSNYPQMVESIPNEQFDIDFSPPQIPEAKPIERSNEYSSNNDESGQYLEQKMGETKLVKKKINNAKSPKKTI